MKSFLSSLAVSFVFLTNGASAYTSFAGSCPAGSNAGISPSPVPLDHTDFGVGSPSGREGLSGTLSDGATVLVINGVVMDPAAATVDFPSATDLVWEVQAVQVPFRGLLLRVEADEANTFTVTSDNADIVPATLCDGQPGNVVGLNHNSATNRDLRTGVMRFDGTGPVAVDVSVVYANRNVAPDNISVFAYSGFSINIVGASAPVETPAPAPVETPETPVPVPTDAGTPEPVVPTDAGTPEPVVPTDAGTPEPVVPTDAGTPEPVVPTDAGTPEPVVPTDAGTPEPVVPTDVATPEPGVPTAGTEEDCPEGKGKKAKGEGKGKSGTKTGKGKSGTKTGKGKSGTKTGKGKGDGKGKKCKEPKTPKAGGSEKKVGKGGGDGKGKGELRSRN